MTCKCWNDLSFREVVREEDAIDMWLNERVFSDRETRKKYMHQN